ncbi:MULTISPECIES: hypothetical protein [unclassified Mesorhizobium]|uniref:hypothetical protein n=1 Tax=unclassified Mesorhizobium TaxID=325217 RepID=UPI000BB07556|nr:MULTISPECIES: hypothetical protein [unclassified Mesorhizobium]PBC22144.1 hypothetical protein CK226_16030 [Mesorhizobium sp. WSM4311]TRD09657.1 hypothetical protein FJV82_02935 [Mesorhizobium sp. WSM4305]
MRRGSSFSEAFARQLQKQMREVDLTTGFADHRGSKVYWVIMNVAVSFVFCDYLQTFPSLNFYEVVGLGVVASFTFPIIWQAIIAAALRMAASKGSFIAHAPGGRLIAVLRFLFTKRAFDNIFSQVVMDGREEYWEALTRGDRWLARWRRVQLYLSLAIAAGTWIGVSTLKRAIKMWKAG